MPPVVGFPLWDTPTGGGATDRFLTPDPVTIPVVTAAPTIAHVLTLTPDPVTIPILTAIPYVAYAGRNDARVSQAGLEVIYDTSPSATISQAGLEVIYDQVVPVRVSQAGLEVIYLPGTTRKVFAEIIDS